MIEYIQEYRSKGISITVEYGVRDMEISRAIKYLTEIRAASKAQDEMVESYARANETKEGSESKELVYGEPEKNDDKITTR